METDLPERQNMAVRKISMVIWIDLELTEFSAEFFQRDYGRRKLPALTESN